MKEWIRAIVLSIGLVLFLPSLLLVVLGPMILALILEKGWEFVFEEWWVAFLIIGFIVGGLLLKIADYLYE